MVAYEKRRRLKYTWDCQLMRCCRVMTDGHKMGVRFLLDKQLESWDAAANSIGVKNHKTLLRFIESKLAGFVDAFAGQRCIKFKREWSRTQRYSDITDDLLWVHRLLVTQSDQYHRQLLEQHRRLHDLVLPLHCGDGVHEQLHQPFHLRRQVSRVPGGSQTPAALRFNAG